MEEAKRSHRLSIDGYEISASFLDKKNPTAIHQAREILLKTFAVGILDHRSRGVTIIAAGALLYLENFIRLAY